MKPQVTLLATEQLTFPDKPAFLESFAQYSRGLEQSGQGLFFAIAQTSQCLQDLTKAIDDPTEPVVYNSAEKYASKRFSPWQWQGRLKAEVVVNNLLQRIDLILGNFATRLIPIMHQFNRTHHHSLAYYFCSLYQ